MKAITRCALLSLSCAPLLASQATSAKPQSAECTIIGASLSNGTSLKSLSVMLGIKDTRKFAEGTLGRKISDFELRVRSETVGMRVLLRKLFAGGDVSLKDCSDTMFFMSPVQKGERQLKRASRRSGIIIGLDFMFWFGYGRIANPRGGYTERDIAVHRALSRLALQKRGLALLDKYLVGTKRPLILGDYPNMTGAVERMLPRTLIPGKRVREELNQRLHAWAAKRDNVFVYPLAARFDQARRGELVVATADGDKKLNRSQLLQLDRLHPNTLGMAVIANDLLRFLDEKVPQAKRLPGDRKFAGILQRLDQVETWKRRSELQQ